MEKCFPLLADIMSIEFSASFDLDTNIFAPLSRNHEQQNEQSKPMLTSHIFSKNERRQTREQNPRARHAWGGPKLLRVSRVRVYFSRSYIKKIIRQK